MAGSLELIATPENIGATSVTNDEIDYIGAYGSGFDLRLFADLVRMRKELRFTPADLPTPTINAEWVRLGVRFNVDNGVNIFIDGVEWGAGNSPDVETANNVEFRDDSGDVLWTFNSPVAWNETAVSDAPIMSSWYRKQGPNLSVQIYLPYSWVLAQGADDVIMLDPAIDTQAGTSTDDADESWSGTIDLTDTKVLTWGGGSGGSTAGIRFGSVPIPAGATIVASYLSVLLYNSGVDSPSIDIYAEDGDSPGTFTSTTNDITNRTKTTAKTAWSDTDLALTWQGSPSLNDVIQEITDRPGWASGNALAFILDPVGSRSDFYFRSYDHAAANAPKLHTEYATGGGGDSIPYINNLRQRRFQPLLVR